jgi:hypothetical protein
MQNKVLLLQGPIESVGINFFSERIYRTPEERKLVWAKYDCGENVRALSHVFRSFGYKIVYSAWSEDSDWIIKNANLFDAVCVNSQAEIASTVEFMGRPIQNNKEKLYRSIYAGLIEIQKQFGADCAIVRMRSDIAVDIREIEKAVEISEQFQSSFLVEYADQTNIFYVPDFITVGSLALTMSLYRNLISLCDRNESYHISSHIDHGIELFNLQEKGILKHLICMHKEVHDSMVWRGIPRFYGQAYTQSTVDLLFNCSVKYPSTHSVESIKAHMNPMLSGRR